MPCSYELSSSARGDKMLYSIETRYMTNNAGTKRQLEELLPSGRVDAATTRMPCKCSQGIVPNVLVRRTVDLLCISASPQHAEQCGDYLMSAT
jgi:hypothetical protein